MQGFWLKGERWKFLPIFRRIILHVHASSYCGLVCRFSLGFPLKWDPRFHPPPPPPPPHSMKPCHVMKNLALHFSCNWVQAHNLHTCKHITYCNNVYEKSASAGLEAKRFLGTKFLIEYFTEGARNHAFLLEIFLQCSIQMPGHCTASVRSD